LVHVLSGKAEHVIVEPVSAHGLVPVTGNFIKTTRVRWARRHYVLSGVIDGVTASEDDRVVIIVELVREEVGPREAVIFRPVVSVVFVGRNRVHAKPAVVFLVYGESVVKAEQYWLAVAHLHELGRNGSVVSPDLVDLLSRQIRVKLQRDRSRRVDARIHVRRNLWIVGGVGLGAFL